MVEPGSFRHFRLKLHYMRTETAGPLFEYMKAQLAGIATQTHMDKVFVLRGADIYRVLDIESVDPHIPPAPPPADALLSLRRTLDRLGDTTDLSDLADRGLAALTSGFGIRHALLLMLDEAGAALYTLGSLGYPDSGIGAEVKVGEGLIGVDIGLVVGLEMSAQPVGDEFQETRPPIRTDRRDRFAGGRVYPLDVIAVDRRNR